MWFYSGKTIIDSQHLLKIILLQLYLELLVSLVVTDQLVITSRSVHYALNGTIARHIPNIRLAIPSVLMQSFSINVRVEMWNVVIIQWLHAFCPSFHPAAESIDRELRDSRDKRTKMTIRTVVSTLAAAAEWLLEQVAWKNLTDRWRSSRHVCDRSTCAITAGRRRSVGRSP